MDILFIVSLALAADMALGEPPRFIHPVVWMGKLISFLEKGGINQTPAVQLFYGLGMVLVSVGLFIAPAYLILLYLKSLNFIAYVIIGAVLLKSTFSLRELRQSALRVRGFLQEDKLDEARFELRSLVSRDTSGLPKPLLASAAVESVAESTCDSFIAPLFYFLLLGIPGAIAYRVVNTMDAMTGYHGKYEYLGKFASKLDDILNYIPARLTALLLFIAAFLSKRNGRASWQVATRDHCKTESPNAGWPIAAAAGALNIQLEKTGQYKIGNAGSAPAPGDIDSSLKLVQLAMLVWVIICLITGVICFVLTA